VKLTARRAVEQDCSLLWEWANDPQVRDQSFTQTPISWDDHVKWFQARLAAPACAIFVVLDESQRPVAQVRFEVQENGEAVIDVSVAAAHRGFGLGASVLREACAAFGRESGARPVAYVKPGNVASLRAFERAGFTRAWARSLGGTDPVRFDWRTPPEETVR